METEKPLVSIIVPTYNVEKYIDDCFYSLINQKLSNIEIIFVDDGSEDNSGKICDQYKEIDSRVKVIHQINQGLGISRNTGLKIAKGKYVGFVDSDDIVSLNMFKTLYDNATLYDADISYCRFKRFNKKSEIHELEKRAIIKEEIDVFNKKEQLRDYYLNRIGMPANQKADIYCSASVCCCIFKREKLLETNIEFVSEKNLIAEDMIFDLTYIPYCKSIVHSNLELYYYRNNNESLTKTYKENRFKKNVELYHEMERIISKRYTKEQYISHLNRYFLTFLRNSIIQEIIFLKKNNIKHVREQIKYFLSFEESRSVLKNYSIQLLTFKYRLFFTLLKMKMINIVILITYLKYHKNVIK